ncbi:MAG: hypothetical protein JXJ04_00430 [Spirochaetales bacterium]|nr:hypothetical protein [Spirochaetales bacterium]
MEYNEIIILTRIVTGAIGAFFSILLWSKTREPAWIFIIIGSLCYYTEIIFSTLETFGILKKDILVIAGIPLVKILLINLPILFITIGFITILINKKNYS